jgi:CRP/FNR family cyclic AMP-dependent transcriptional regulator
MSLTPCPNIYSNFEYLGAASAYTDDVYEAIGVAPLFDRFSKNEIAALCQFMHCFVAPRGGMLLAEGDEGDYALIILSGNVGVQKLSPEGELVTIASVCRGSSLGEMSLIDGERRFASCVATEPTDFAVFTRADLNEMLLRHPRLANKFLIKLMQILVGRLRTTGNLLLSNYSTVMKEHPPKACEAPTKKTHRM